MTNRDWHSDAFPDLRPVPPWVMQEMIAAQPPLVKTLLADPPHGIAEAAGAIADAVKRNRPVIVCGCGTSEHPEHAITALISTAVDAEQPPLVQARPALSAALDAAPGVCLAVSHDGKTRASTLALHAAHTVGARTIAIAHQLDASVACRRPARLLDRRTGRRPPSARARHSRPSCRADRRASH